jgi:hypothetical protein
MSTITLRRVLCPSCHGAGKYQIPACRTSEYAFWCDIGYCDCQEVTVKCNCDGGMITVDDKTGRTWRQQ